MPKVVHGTIWEVTQVKEGKTEGYWFRLLGNQNQHGSLFFIGNEVGSLSGLRLTSNECQGTENGGWFTSRGGDCMA